MASIMDGVKRGKVLTYNGFRYQKNRETANNIYWRCWRKTCRSPLTSNVFDLNDNQSQIDVLQVGTHDHEEDDALITSCRIFNEAKNALRNDPTRPIKRTFDEVIANYDGDSDEELPVFGQQRSRLQRVRAASLPPLPANINDVDIDDEWSRTWRGDNFLSHIDNNWGIAIFVTSNNLRILQRSEKVFIDGTFKTCPKPYTQFVSLHGQYLNRVFTLAMCLLTGKSVGQYRQVIQHLKQRVRHITGHRWRPSMAVCDFEHGLILVLETELPTTRIRTCYFHFCQSLWRNLQEWGLAGPYRHRRRLRTTIRKVMSIGHLPVALVRQNFNLLTTDRSTRRLVNRYPSLNDFLSYVRNTYIHGTFPVAMWNVYERGHDCRTNNIVEGFHSRWNKAVGAKHPSLWVFIRKMKDEERRQRLKLRQARTGGNAYKTEMAPLGEENQETQTRIPNRNGYATIPLLLLFIWKFIFSRYTGPSMPYAQGRQSIMNLANQQEFEASRNGKLQEYRCHMNQPEGCQPVRQYHRRDESKILPHVRRGLKIDLD